MITKMKKLTFLIYYKEYEAFLKRMQELGVLHVQTAQEGSVEPTSELEAKLKQTEHVKAWINRLEAMEATDVRWPLTGVRQISFCIWMRWRSPPGEKTELQVCVRMRLRCCLGAISIRCVSRGCRDIGYAMGFFVCPERSFNEEWAELYLCY